MKVAAVVSTTGGPGKTTRAGVCGAKRHGHSQAGDREKPGLTLIDWRGYARSDSNQSDPNESRHRLSTIDKSVCTEAPSNWANVAPV